MILGDDLYKTLWDGNFDTWVFLKSLEGPMPTDKDVLKIMFHQTRVTTKLMMPVAKRLESREFLASIDATGKDHPITVSEKLKAIGAKYVINITWDQIVSTRDRLFVLVFSNTLYRDKQFSEATSAMSGLVDNKKSSVLKRTIKLVTGMEIVFVMNDADEFSVSDRTPPIMIGYTVR
jgi:hypothetical protein